MKVQNFSVLESQIMSLFNEGNKTFDLLLEKSSINEKTLSMIMDSLVARNIFKFNTKNNEYEYQSRIEGGIVLLDGNILLPTTILRFDDKILVCRGNWYEFPVDFDVRRIVWNVKLDQTTNSTLVDLIKSSILKQKKTKIVQLPEYQQLVGKIVPYSKNMGLLLNVIGEDVTEITIVFKIQLTPKDASDELCIEHRNFRVNSEISTNDLIDQLKLPVSERDFVNGIRLNRLFNLSDFLVSKNEIPISMNENGDLFLVKITGVRKSLELTYYRNYANGTQEKIDVENYEHSDGLEKLRELFQGYAMLLLNQNNFNVELSE